LSYAAARVTTGEVLEVRRQGPGAATLRLRADGFRYRPGQHVKLDPYQFPELGPRLREREAARGKQDGPSYFSISSDGLEEDIVEITPRLPRDGREALVAAQLVDRVRTGDRVAFDGPGGRYGLPEEPPAGIDAFLHVCAGSGVAPNRGMIRYARGRGWGQAHVLVLQERGPDDVLFGEDWASLGGAFHFRPVFSRRDGSYLTAALLEDSLREVASPASSMAFVCGPNDPRGGRPGFCDHAAACLRSIGVAPGRIVREGG
jgi:ferredoxin-NADP reductase